MPFTFKQKRTPQSEYPNISVHGITVAIPMSIPTMITTYGPPANAATKVIVWHKSITKGGTSGMPSPKALHTKAKPPSAAAMPIWREVSIGFRALTPLFMVTSSLY
nr:hypothetical protein [Candidatus Baldrarchaeota archaeon]